MGTPGYFLILPCYVTSEFADSIMYTYQDITMACNESSNYSTATDLLNFVRSSKHNEVANYRPISLLPVVRKLLERHIHQVITTHLNETRPLSNKQWGFQPGKSTVTALLAVTHDWLKALESRHNVCSVFLDLHKAFDSVLHRLLLEKLNTYALDSCILS